MNFGELEHFIKKKMQMTHIYQPVMIKKLLESGNRATAEDIAKIFIDYDESLLEYYKGRVMTWPKQVLTKHGVVRYKKGVFTLVLDDVTQEQRGRLIELCDLRTDEYVDAYPNRLGVKSVREPLSSGIRYDVLAKSKGVCAACGASPPRVSLDVDHVVPVNMGGASDPSNLQVLCASCNRDKRDRDRTNFVKWRKRLKFRDPSCSLCQSRPVKSNGLASVICPVHGGDALPCYAVIPKRHVGTFFDLIPAEKSHCIDLIDRIKADVTDADSAVDRFDVSFSSGITAGTQEHCSINVVPRL